jgi:hypothetical protein
MTVTPGAYKPAFYDRWLEVSCLVFGVASLAWAFMGSLDPFGLWDGFAADALFGGQTPAEVVRFRRFILGPFGATSAAYFLLLYYVVRNPFRRRDRSAFSAVTASLLLWFVVDSSMSLLHGAAFNVLLVNVPCLVVLGIPLLGLRSQFKRDVGDSAIREERTSGARRETS